MIRYIKKIDAFGRNIILVFLGTSLVNVFNLLYQLLIAHRLSGIDFAGFNSLLAVFTLISSPLMTLQTAVAKYTADFNARNEVKKINALLRSLIIKITPAAIITLSVFYYFSFHITAKLKIASVSAGYILTLLLVSAWATPVLLGALQGLELFKWLTSISVIGGALKLILAFIFISLGFNIAGALGALLVSGLIGIIISVFALRNYFSLEPSGGSIDLGGVLPYLAPVAVTSFCFTALVNIDMIMVKSYFSPTEAGFYSLAQMVGKIFLFLPFAISVVMFPRAAGLNARKLDTTHTLKRSLLYAAILCIAANLVYNFFPVLILKILTGKASLESVEIGRLFGISMSFFALLFVLLMYFLSIKDLRFIKFLIVSVLLEALAIVFFHGALIHVQLALCINSILIFLACLPFVFKRI